MLFVMWLPGFLSLCVYFPYSRSLSLSVSVTSNMLLLRERKKKIKENIKVNIVLCAYILEKLWTVFCAVDFVEVAVVLIFHLHLHMALVFCILIEENLEFLFNTKMKLHQNIRRISQLIFIILMPRTHKPF